MTDRLTQATREIERIEAELRATMSGDARRRLQWSLKYWQRERDAVLERQAVN
jgi:hypothetical protein